MIELPSAVTEYVVFVATGLFKRISQRWHLYEATVVVNGLRDRNNLRREPGPPQACGVERIAKDAPHQMRLLKPFAFVALVVVREIESPGCFVRGVRSVSWIPPRQIKLPLTFRPNGTPVNSHGLSALGTLAPLFADPSRCRPHPNRLAECATKV
jgi:hypothetical protein